MKYAFVTGSTKGIGKAIGLKLLQENYFVIFNYAHSEDDANKLDAEIRTSHKDKYQLLKADLSDLNQIETITSKLLAITQQLDVVVFNAGLTDRSRFGEISSDSWQKVFNANLNVPFFLMQALKDHLAREANIVFIGSMLGNIPHSVSLAYGVSKSAIHSLVQNMVKFLSPEGIRINAIAPGFVETEWQKEKPEWLQEKIKGKVALKRFAQPEEVATLCCQIIENRYLTGQIIQLDGGYCYE